MRPLVLALLLAAGPALAEGPGRYAVQGTNPGGEGRYGGTATLSQTGRNTWSIAWRVGSDSYSGYGVGDGRVLAFSYVGGGSAGVVSYVANADGSYSGLWTTANGRNAGTERLIPQ